MYSPVTSDNDADNDDVTGTKHAGNYDVTSGGRDTYVVASLTAEGDNKTANISKELATECSRGSDEGDSQMEVSADRSSETADCVSEIADQDDDGGGGSVYLSDDTMSKSLEEKDQEALALERSNGLAQSTGETFEYLESDEPSGSVTPVDGDLEMTLRMKDVGSPIAQSTLIDDDRFPDEPKDAGNILPQNNSFEVTTTKEKRQEDSCSTDFQAELELEKRQLEGNLSSEDSKNVEDNLRSQPDNLELTADQQHHQIVCTTADVEDEVDFVQQELERSCSTVDVEEDEDIFPRENHRLHSTTGHQQLDEDISTAQDDDDDSDDGDGRNYDDDDDARLELKESELKEDSIDVGDPLGQTVTLRDASEASVSSSQDQTAEVVDITKDQHDSESPENDNEDPVDLEKTIYSGNNFEEDGTQQPDTGLYSTNADPFIDADPNHVENDGGSFLEQTINVAEDSIPSASDQTLLNADGLVRQEETSCGEKFDENGMQDDEEDAMLDVYDLAVELNQDLPIAEVMDHHEVYKDVGVDLSQNEGPSSQQDRARFAFDGDFPIVVSTDHNKEIRLEEDRTREEIHTICQDLDNPYTDLDLSVTASTPECLQLELLNKSVVETTERRLEVVQSAAASNSWSADEEKNNLLCLLDNRRRNEIDKDNWQLARHIEDEMTLVKDAELDDLENVQVSVKVSHLCDENVYWNTDNEV